MKSSQLPISYKSAVNLSPHMVAMISRIRSGDQSNTHRVLSYNMDQAAQPKEVTKCKCHQETEVEAMLRHNNTREVVSQAHGSLAEQELNFIDF